MVALALAAMLLGNCFSCPQVLAAMSAHQPSHDCCPGPKSASLSCPTQGLQHFVKADSAPHTPAVYVLLGMVEPAAPASLSRQWTPATLPVDHTPPDVLSLTTSLRI